MRHIAYVSGTRADFGLVKNLLTRAQGSGLRISVCATGMHLLRKYGRTVAEIEAAGLPIMARIRTGVEGASGVAMARGIGRQIMQLTEVWRQHRPDAVLVLGDRGEMLAGAISAIHLNIPVVHLHGGERSGSVDEPVRHAISKLSHYHFVATLSAKKRLVRMGEAPSHIFVTGAPSLDGILDSPQRSRRDLCAQFDLTPEWPLAVLLFHPVVQNARQAGRESRAAIRALLAEGFQVLWLLPNSDAGSDAIRAVAQTQRDTVRVISHLPRPDYLALLNVADLLAGNSSSGIVEAASFGIPVVNIGHRQNLRDRNRNVIDVAATQPAIVAGIRRARTRGRRKYRNIYSSGDAGGRIIRLLKRLPLGAKLLDKANAY